LNNSSCAARPWGGLSDSQFGVGLHERFQSLVSYFCMSVDAPAGGCALFAQRLACEPIGLAL